jgi:DNA modification methylase
LRDYGSDGQLGVEPTPELFIRHLVETFREVRRVLHDDGTLWVNIGDSYARAPGKGRSGNGKEAVYVGSREATLQMAHPVPFGLKPKDLIGIPWMLAFSLRADGWYLRSDIIWNKPNAKPDGVKDRPTAAHEHLFLLSKNERYYYNAKAIQEPTTDGKRHRNCRNVWVMNTGAYQGAHLATFPVELPSRCVRAASRVDDVVLDPFAGSGTTLAVAKSLGRHYIGIELNRKYKPLIDARLCSNT